MALALGKNYFPAQYLENKWREYHQILYMHLYIDKIYFGIVAHHLCTFLPELWPLIYAINSFPFNILRTNGQNFTKFYICIHIYKIQIGIVTHHFSHICTSVMALDLLQNFVTVQYLKNKWTEFHRILYMHSY